MVAHIGRGVFSGDQLRDCISASASRGMSATNEFHGSLVLTFVQLKWLYSSLLRPVSLNHSHNCGTFAVGLCLLHL